MTHPIPDSVRRVTLYHGTTVRAWRRRRPARATLYLTSNREDAEQYAYERAACNEEDGHAPEPLLIVVAPEMLTALLERGLALDPDWGWVTSVERERAADWQPTWQESYDACGGVCLPDFRHQDKRLLTPERLPVYDGVAE